MRNHSVLTALFPQVRQGVLAATLGQPDKWWYLSELADHLGTTPSSLQRELSSLVASGILVHRREGTRAYFRAETQSPVFRDLQQLFEKTAGLAPILEQILKPLGNKIQCAFIYGSVARSREHAMSDVDVMVIGSAGLADLSPALRKAEERLGREVNVTAYSLEEFREKIKSHDHFIAAVLRGRKQFVNGGQSDLDEIVGNKEAQRHKTSKKELDNMRALIARDLADAGIVGLSADRRFATAYNAALQAANMAIACAGYRIMSKVGHHRVSLESTKLVLGKPAHKYADYFETCRRKRNTIDYTFSNVATETEAREILVQAAEFYNQVEDWITKTHPSLKM